MANTDDCICIICNHIKTLNIILSISNNIAKCVDIMTNAFESIGTIDEKVADECHEIARSYADKMKGIHSTYDVLLYDFDSITKATNIKNTMIHNHFDQRVYPLLAASSIMAINAVGLANIVKDKMFVSPDVVNGCKSSTRLYCYEFSTIGLHNNELARAFHSIINNLHLVKLYDDVTDTDFMY